MRLILCALLFAAVFSGNLPAAMPGEMDFSFGPFAGSGSPEVRTGRVKVSFAQGQTAAAKALAVQPGGRIIAAGRTLRPGLLPDTALLRLLPDGTLDPSFGQGGMALAGLTGASEAAALALLPDGKIITAGPSTRFHPQGIGVIRFLPDGSLDATFGTGGVADAAEPGGEQALVTALQVLNDGGVVVLSRQTGGFQLSRLRSNGTKDTGFNRTGLLRVPGVLPASLLVTPDGRIIVGGSDDPDHAGRFWIGRFLPDGRLDPSFGGTGNVKTPFDTGAHLRALQLAPDGTLLAAGTLLLPAAGEYIFASARYLPGGSLDPSFYNSGRLIGDVLGFEPAGATFAPDGKVLMHGFFQDRTATVIRVLPDGSTDHLFNAVVAAQSHPFEDQANFRSISSVLPLPAGRFLAAGESRGMMDIVRYFSEPVPGIFGIVDNAGTPVVSGQLIDAGEAAIGSEFFRTFTLRNTGTGQLAGMRMEQIVNDSSAFSQLDSVPAVLLPGDSPDFRIRFAPVTTGALEMEFRFFSSSLPGTFFSLRVKGQGAVHAPRMSLSAPGQASPLEPGATVPLGTVARGTPVARPFTVRNTGNAPLTLYGIEFTGDAGDFSASSLAETTLPAGGVTVFTVTFRPSAGGLRTARMVLSTSASTDRLFPVNLEGQGTSLLDSWRERYFGLPDNTGPGADGEDADGDGRSNLMEFATLTDPRKPDARDGALTLRDSLMEYRMECPAEAHTELSYTFEWSPAPAGPWSGEGTSVSIAGLPDQRQQMIFTAPAGEQGRRFARMRVTRRTQGIP